MTSLRKAVAATGHPEVSAVAAEILRQGGNAFDAAIAAGFAGAVAEPALTSLGGGGFLLAKTREKDGSSQEIFFDFFVDTPGRGFRESLPEPHFFPVTVHFPGSDQVFNVGRGSAAVPGNLKGFLHVHQRLGRLELKKILQPAIRMARDGVVINASQAYFLSLLQPIMTFSETGRQLFRPGGRYLAHHDRLFNPELAAFLDRLDQDRAHSFYNGELAAAIDSDMRQGAGLLTVEDLAAYHVTERTPLAIPYRDYTLLTNPPPAMGGSLMKLALSLLALLPTDRSTWGSPGHITEIGGLLAEVERLRGEEVTPAALQEAHTRLRLFSRGTTHVSIADTEGNVASMTTSNGEGSGYFAPGTGIMLNNMMGEDDLHPDGFHMSPAGQRVGSMMAPSLLKRHDMVELVLGTGGSKRIRTAILQVLNNVVDFRMGLQEAVSAPRLHWDGAVMQIEPGLHESAVAALAKIWPVNVWSAKDMYFGGVHAVIPGKAGAGDPRRGGAAVELVME